MKEYHLAVERTARLAVVGERGPDVRDIVIACHGFGQLAHRFARPFESLARPDRLIVAPEALSRYYLDPGPGRHGPEARVGATWMTREDRLREIADYVGYLDRVLDWATSPGGPPPALTALGFSQGVATVLRWLALGRARAARVVLWAGMPPDDLTPAQLTTAIGDAEVTVVAGDQDPFVTPERLDAALQLLRPFAPHLDVVRFEGGHKVEPLTLAKVLP